MVQLWIMDPLVISVLCLGGWCWGVGRCDVVPSLEFSEAEVLKVSKKIRPTKNSGLLAFDKLKVVGGLTVPLQSEMEILINSSLDLLIIFLALIV
jgi:hypothetical protein